MKTAYDLFHNTDPNAAYTDRRGRFDTPSGAAREAGNPNLELWQYERGDGGAWRLVAGARDSWLITAEQVPENDAESIELALDVIARYSGIDGDDHKTWVFDQAVRYLARDRYEAWVEEHCDGVDGPETYSWDEGVAP